MHVVLDFERPLVELRRRIEGLRAMSLEGGTTANAILELERQAVRLQEQIFANLSPWQRTQLSRHPGRPNFDEYVAGWTSDWVELHGDRAGHDDQAIGSGVGMFRGHRVVIIGHKKGRTTRENVVCNFGMALPDGYRKALRLMQLADRFGMPIITLIDTPGAYPGLDAEARGQAEAIARNLLEMFTFRVPIIACVIGEGGSGGALALGCGNRVLMMEHAVYSVISPEGCAAILWHDRAEGPRAAEALKITATDCLKFGVADEVVAEPVAGAHRSADDAVARLGDAVERHLGTLSSLTAEELKAHRYERFRALGAFEIGA
ncbi:MAG: acetyl-CoA carboxylase carboxyltransferase subunit alpha [Myxococcales bacterium]|nr:acetyl-CoA carboxylase carboxyltransferase subunit alpha [Myxococcales bacterium]